MKRERGLFFLVPEGRFSGGQEGDSWWDENIVSRNNWNYFEKMAFGLGIKSRFWLCGLGGEPISGNKYDRKFAVKPISGRNSHQKLGINMTGISLDIQFLGIIASKNSD